MTEQERQQKIEQCEKDIETLQRNLEELMKEEIDKERRKEIVFHLGIKKSPIGRGVFMTMDSVIEEWNGKLDTLSKVVAWYYTKSEVKRIIKILQEMIGE